MTSRSILNGSNRVLERYRVTPLDQLVRIEDDIVTFTLEGFPYKFTRQETRRGYAFYTLRVVRGEGEFPLEGEVWHEGVLNYSTRPRPWEDRLHSTFEFLEFRLK
ncbi:MAG: hypothetical protein ACE5FT_00580 [Candidatus Nanoarchaeia archaeon]